MIVFPPSLLVVSIDALSNCALTSTLSRTVTVALTSDSAAVGRVSLPSLAMMSHHTSTPMYLCLDASNAVLRGIRRNHAIRFRKMESQFPLAGIISSFHGNSSNKLVIIRFQYS